MTRDDGMRLYGLKTCDTCRKAMKTLRSAGYDVNFVDLRADALTPAEIARLLDVLGEDLVNRRSTTWRGLPEAERALPAAELLGRYPALMKRPVIENGADLHLGWSPQVQARFTAGREG